MRHQGELLKELLRAHKKKQVHLYKAAGVDSATTWRWTHVKEFSETQWAKIAPALAKLGIDPEEIRPLPSAGEVSDEDARLAAVWPLIEGMSRKQTEITLQILSLKPDVLATVRAILRDRLSRTH